MRNIGFIGQRFGGTADEDSYPVLVKFLREWLSGLLKNGEIKLHSATGIGVDIAAIEAAHSLGIPVVAYEPFPNHTVHWGGYWRSYYARLVNNPGIERRLVYSEYVPGIYDRRNSTIISASDDLYVFWDGHGDNGMGRVVPLLAYSRRGPASLTNLAKDWLADTLEGE